MRLRQVVGAVAVAAVLIVGTSLCSAQVKGSRNGPPNQGNKLGKGLGQMQGRQGNQLKGIRNEDPSDQLMRKAAKECMAAVKVMRRALPIYHGHRVKAMRLAEFAVAEIRLGLFWDKNPGQQAASNNLQQKLASLQNAREEGGRFSDEQIQRSNMLMRQAGDILLVAKADLLAATKPYGTYKANAIRLVDMAIEEVRLALDSVNRQGP